MKFLRIIIFLFVVGSYNVIGLLLAHTLPSLEGYHQEAVAVTAGFLIIANAIVLYILYFWLYDFKTSDRYRKFEEILSECKTETDDEQEAFDRAIKRWKDKK